MSGGSLLGLWGREGVTNSDGSLLLVGITRNSVVYQHQGVPTCSGELLLLDHVLWRVTTCDGSQLLVEGHWSYSTEGSLLKVGSQYL